MNDHAGDRTQLVPCVFVCFPGHGYYCAGPLPACTRRAYIDVLSLGTWVLIAEQILIGLRQWALRCKLLFFRYTCLAGQIIAMHQMGPWGFCVDDDPSMGISVAVVARCSPCWLPLLFRMNGSSGGVE